MLEKSSGLHPCTRRAYSPTPAHSTLAHSHLHTARSFTHTHTQRALSPIPATACSLTHTCTQHALSPTLAHGTLAHPLSHHHRPIKAVLESLQPAARKATAILARSPPATSGRAREQSRLMALSINFEKQICHPPPHPQVLPVRGVLDSSDRWDSQQGKFYDRTAAHR